MKKTNNKRKHYFLAGVMCLGILAISCSHIATSRAIEEVSASTLQKLGESKPNIKDYAWRQAQLHGLDPVELIVILDCESKFNPQAVNINTNKSFDLGVAQWNSKSHPEISVEDKLNPYKSIDLMIHTRLKDKNYHQWSCAKLRGIK